MKRFFILLTIFITTSYTSTQAQTKTLGLFEYNVDEAFEAYTLFSPNESTNTYLIDNCGHLVNTWESDHLPGLSFYLLENGDMIRAAEIEENYGFNVAGFGGLIERFNWEGELIWSYQYASSNFMQHHDFKMLPNGNIIFIAWEFKSNAEAQSIGINSFDLLFGPAWPLTIIEIEPNETSADVVWEWHLWDHLIQEEDASLSNYAVLAENPGKLNALDFGYGFVNPSDMLHCNALDYNPQLDQIIFSSRNLSEIFIIDHSTTNYETAGNVGGNSGKGGQFLWRWGNPSNYNSGNNQNQKLFRQHDVQWIDEGLNNAGKVMVFNNGLGRPGGDQSSVEIISPEMDADGNYVLNSSTGRFGPETSDYTYMIQENWLSGYESNAQILDNDHMFICLGVLGRMIELNENEDIVWHYLSPVGDNGSIMEQGDELTLGFLPGSTENAMFRAYRYGVDYPAFEGLTIESNGPIEINALQQDIDCEFVVTIEEPMDTVTSVFTYEPSNFSILVNPVQSNLHLQNLQIGRIEITDLNGRIIKSLETNHSDIQLSVDDLDSGIYFVRNDLSIQKFIKL